MAIDLDPALGRYRVEKSGSKITPELNGKLRDTNVRFCLKAFFGTTSWLLTHAELEKMGQDPVRRLNNFYSPNDASL
jgi:hypothetical protein